MSDFRLEVFYTVAKRLSFTKAAAELFITQPAVTRHIHELEEQYNTKLFQRNGNTIVLTPSGELLLKFSEDLFAVYRSIEYEMKSLANRRSGTLRIGASSTIAQYLIPPILARFGERHPEVAVKLMTGNTEQIEEAVMNKEIELGMIEGKSKNNAIKYVDFIKDDIVLVCNKENKIYANNEITPQHLCTLPLLLREPGSGTLEVIGHELKKHHIKLSDLTVKMQLGSTEGIKSYLLHSACFAFLSIHSIVPELQNSSLQIVNVKNLSIKRMLHFIYPQGKAEALPELFVRFARHHNQ